MRDLQERERERERLAVLRVRALHAMFRFGDVNVIKISKIEDPEPKLGLLIYNSTIYN